MTKRLILGWGGYNRAAITNEAGKYITGWDGFFIIHLGRFGLLNLITFFCLVILSVLHFTRCYPVETWKEKETACSSVLVMVTVIYFIDNLLNSTFTPIHFTIIGSLLGQKREDLGLLYSPSL